MKLPWACAAALLLANSTALACVPPLAGRVVEGPRHALSFRTQPAKIEVGRHFTLDISVCAKPGAQLPQSLHVDAQMPEHRHGMNYEPKLEATAAGRYRARGLMFHMPGRWQLSFELREPGATAPERLTVDLPLE